MDIQITKTTRPKARIADESKLGFGKCFSDHMFIMDYNADRGWHSARIVPYAPISLDPAAAVFHYAQECFEGLKAYRTKGNKIQLFRPDCNARRMQSSHRRMCIPEISEEDFLQAVNALVETEKDWVPYTEGASLYLRPFTIATMADLSVHASTSYQFMIICSPSGTYYDSGIDPVRILVEDFYTRACQGGSGYAKCGGNYAVSLLAGEKAAACGCSQVLWLDSKEKKYVEEVGAMNIFFKIDGKIYTALTDDSAGTVLPGVTRRSTIELLRGWGYSVHEEKLAIDAIFSAAERGTLEEVFGTGTAAVISPVGWLDYKGNCIEINQGQIGPVSQKLYDTLTGMQWGTIPDTKGWIYPVCEG